MHPLTRRCTTLLLGACLISGASAGAVAAQDETASPAPSESPGVPQTCDVLTPDEVSSAMSLTLSVTSGGTFTCEFDSDEASGTFVLLLTDVVTGSDLDTARSFSCGGGMFDESPAPTEEPGCAVDVNVGQAAGLYLPDSTTLYVDIGNGNLFSLQVAGDPVAGVDLQNALTGLAAIALPRVATMPMPTDVPFASDGPVPSFTSDADLEALFPTQIGGQQVAVESASGQDIADGGGVPDEFLTALSEVGKSIADVSIGIGYSADGSADYSITAFKVKGTDMAALKSRLLPVIYQNSVDEGSSPAPAASLVEVPQTVGGKDVTAITIDGSTQYLYPKGDVLWVVAAEEPLLTEILQKLP